MYCTAKVVKYTHVNMPSSSKVELISPLHGGRRDGMITTNIPGKGKTVEWSRYILSQ